MNLQNTKTAAVALFVGTLLLGILIGVVVDRMLLLPAPPFAGMRQFEGRPPRSEGLFMRHFSDQLDLTPRQRAELDSILAGNRQRFDELRRRTHPRYSALRDSLDRQILAILTPPQREKFESLKRQRRQPWRDLREERR